MITFFQNFSGIYAGLSEKADGSMKVSPERPAENQENRGKFLAAQGIPADRVVSADLVHGTKVVVVSDPSQVIISETDALITTEKNLFLSVTVADCLPVFFYDPVARVIGIAHSGWKGTMNGIIGATLETLRRCGASTENIAVAFGPSIRQCHFEIQADILPQFAYYEKYITQKNGKIFVDLQGIVGKQLRALGIREEHIAVHPLCTACEEDTFFSYRRDKPAHVEAMLAVIGMPQK